MGTAALEEVRDEEETTFTVVGEAGEESLLEADILSEGGKSKIESQKNGKEKFKWFLVACTRLYKSL